MAMTRSLTDCPYEKVNGLSSHIRKLRLLKEKFPSRIDCLGILKIGKLGL
jgi:hypothetical protein